MKLSNVILAVASLVIATSASAQFNRVGSAASVDVNYVQINAPQTTSWQGVDMVVLVPIKEAATWEGQTFRFNVDLNVGYQATSGGVSDRNASYYGVGGTTWLNYNFEKEGFSLAPYFRAGLQGNSGNFNATNLDYVAYSVEPGVVGKMGDFYALVAYSYGSGFNADQGSVISMPKVGLGVNLTKDFALETRYEMNRGSYNFDRFLAGVVYKF
jgi:hypothetical protein